METVGYHSPGWYQDPSHPQRLRWHDGERWTDDVHGSDVPPHVLAEQAANGCQVCGAGPAMRIYLRGLRIELRTDDFLTYRGQYCRDCGPARFREVQSQTLGRGWWGPLSVVFNTYNVFHNLNQWRQLRTLDAPQGRLRVPLEMGLSVFKTPGFAVTVFVPVLLILYFAR